jgi:two-component system sensor histidine kinase ChvG
MRMPLGFRPTLRLKLALVALTLLALPWVGYRYVQEMERFLLEAQQQALLATARAVATALHERPQLMRVKPAQSDEARRAAEESLRQAAERAERSGQPVVVEEIGRESGVSEQQSVAEIGAILRGLERSTSRIWVVNRELKLLALAGSLKPQAAPDSGEGAARLWRDVLARIVPRPDEDFDEALDEDVLGTGREITRALLGAPATRLRNSADGRAVIVSAAHPIWSRDDVVGAVVVEETTHSILAVRSQALERLLLTTIVVFALAAAVLLGFATRLSNRIRRLRDEAESAVDARGRLKRLTSGSQAGDEIGDLSRSFSAVLEKLAQHHGYLEKPGRAAVARAAHADRRGALLAGEPAAGADPAQRAGVPRARRGGPAAPVEDPHAHERGDAPRAEPARRNAGRFDLAAVVRECVERLPPGLCRSGLELQAPAQVIRGRRFARPLRPVARQAGGQRRRLRPTARDRVALARAGHFAQLTVTNAGPPIPDAVRGRLFESMISVAAASGPAASRTSASACTSPA